jgi:hypothetical protein
VPKRREYLFKRGPNMIDGRFHFGDDNNEDSDLAGLLMPPKGVKTRPILSGGPGMKTNKPSPFGPCIKVSRLQRKLLEKDKNSSSVMEVAIGDGWKNRKHLKKLKDLTNNNNNKLS